MNRWKVILAAAVIFLAGAGTGAMVGVRTYAPRIVKRIHVSQPLPTTPERRLEYLAKLKRELNLTPDQSAKVEAILAESQKRMKQIWEPVEPEVKEEYKRTRREISEILTPEQREKMKRLRKDGDKNNKQAARDEKKPPC